MLSDVTGFNQARGSFSPRNLRLRIALTAIWTAPRAGVRSYAREVLQEEGYLVAEAGSLDEALLLLALDGISVALTDIVMPGASGIDLAHRINVRAFSCQGSFYQIPATGRLKHGSSPNRSHPTSW